MSLGASMAAAAKGSQLRISFRLPISGLVAVLDGWVSEEPSRPDLAIIDWGGKMLNKSSKQSVVRNN